MAGNKANKDKELRTGNGEQTEKRGSASQDPREHDKGRVSGTEEREYDAQRERRREDEQNEINEEPI